MSEACLAKGGTQQALMRLRGRAAVCGLQTWLTLVMSVAACSGGDQRHSTTLVPRAMNTVEDAGAPQPSMNEDYCIIDQDYLEDHKSCSVDADCVSLTYRPTCCATARLVGVNQESFEELQGCADESVPICACEATPDRAEDGRSVLEGVSTQVRCDAGRCVTGVTERTCGDKLQCKSGEICVSYGDALSDGAPPEPGGNANAYIAYACLPNPCAGALECECSMRACDARGVGKRKCEIARNDESDVACVPYHD